MSALANRANQLFPTAGAIDEERQIGRAAVIDSLAGRFVAGGRDTLMIEPRQVGKTSVLGASLQAARRSADVVVARADLKADGIENSAQLGARLVETAVANGLSLGLLRERAQRVAGKLGRVITVPLQITAAGAAGLGVPADAAHAISAIEQVLERVGRSPFDHVLAALEGYAQLSGRRTIVFVDEVQDIAGWQREGDAVEDALAAAARHPHRQLSFVFAGSQKHALEGLFADDRPLYALSDRYELPKITVADWIDGLRERLRDGGLGCNDKILAHLVEVSNGHPLATMYAAKETFLSAREDGSREVEQVHVAAALARAHTQLWWKEFTAS